MSKLICFQKLTHFEVDNFGRISYKKTDKIDIFKHFTSNVTAPPILVKISWNLQQITTPYRQTKLRRFLNNLENLQFNVNFLQKNHYIKEFGNHEELRKMNCYWKVTNITPYKGDLNYPSYFIYWFLQSKKSLAQFYFKAMFLYHF